MNGTSNVPFELCLNISELYQDMSQVGESRFFLIVKELDANDEAGGEIIDFSLVDHEGNIYECPEHNMPIQNNVVNFYPMDINLNPTGVSSGKLWDFHIYPNPVKDILTIDYRGGIERVDIYDAMGRELMSSQHEEIGVSTWPAGIYFLKITTNDGKVGTMRFLKE
jgi:hypothetical protein